MSVQLEAFVREEQGTCASRRLRRAGWVPAVLYGDNQASEALKLNHKDLMLVSSKPGFRSTVVSLSVEGRNVDVLVRDIQRHPFKPLLMHIDFQRLNPETRVRVKVPVKYTGADVAPAVKVHSGVVSYLVMTIELECSPANLPSFVEVDLSKIHTSQALHISDLNLPAGVESCALKRGDNATLVTVTTKGAATEATS